MNKFWHKKLSIYNTYKEAAIPLSGNTHEPEVITGYQGCDIWGLCI